MLLSDVTALAGSLLERQPSPAAEYRLRRDVLREDPHSDALRALRAKVETCAAAAELRYEQRPDGSWGRFHSMDSSAKARFPTTEFAVDRALALGLDGDSPLLRGAASFMTAVLLGHAVWSDREEKAEGWPQGVQMVTAGTLALIDPSRAELDGVWADWQTIAKAALAGGSHSLVSEQKMERELWGGVAFKRGYLSSRYALGLLGARGRTLPTDLSRTILSWIWQRPQGIGYLEADMRAPNSRRLENWLRSLELLTAFPGWHEVAVDGITWLWEARDADGLWDFGSGLPTGRWFPLADDWRAKGQRQIDHSTRMLILLRRRFE